MNNDPACPNAAGGGGSGAQSGGGGSGGAGSGGAAPSDTPLGAKPNPNGAGRPDLREFLAAVGNLKAGLLPVLTGLSGVGVLLGAGLLALGQQAGVRIAAVSASSGGVVMLGYGFITIFTPH